MAESPIRNHRKYLQYKPYLFVFIGFACYEWNRYQARAQAARRRTDAAMKILLRVQPDLTTSKVRPQEAEDGPLRRISVIRMTAASNRLIISELKHHVSS